MRTMNYNDLFYDHVVFLIMSFLLPKDLIRSRRVSKIFEEVYSTMYRQVIYPLSVTGQCRYYNKVLCREGNVQYNYLSRKIMVDDNGRYFRVVNDHRAVFIDKKYVLLYISELKKYMFHPCPSNECHADTVELWSENWTSVPKFKWRTTKDWRITFSDIIQRAKRTDDPIDLSGYYFSVSETFRRSYRFSQIPKTEFMCEYSKVVYGKLVTLEDGYLVPIKQ